MDAITVANLNGSLTVSLWTGSDGQVRYGFEVGTPNDKALLLVSARDARKIRRWLGEKTPYPPTIWMRRIMMRVDSMIDRWRRG